MPEQKRIKSTRKKNPTPDEVMQDIKFIVRKFGVYIKDCDPFSDYFAEKIAAIRATHFNMSSAYYHATRLESLAYRYQRAKQHYVKNKLKRVA
jgi:hypothetical protein